MQNPIMGTSEKQNANWTKWSSIAEMLSSAAILITLVFLTIGIRQNTDAIQAAAREGVTEREVEWLYVQVQNPELSELMYQAEPLSAAETRRLTSFLVAFMRLKEVGFRQYQAGVLDEATWSNYMSSIVNGPLSAPNARAWWLQTGRILFDQELTALINESLDETPARAPD